jgi:predicted DNA-binding antitoxin AbrB/MazE fold protein
MSEIIVAVYENGVLRPLNPMSLKEGETVRLRIVPEISPGGSKTELETALQSMVDEGVLRVSPKQGEVDPTELSRRQQARKLVKIKGKPLSETIVEDRGPW